jgi:hypothetical protein
MHQSSHAAAEHSGLAVRAAGLNARPGSRTGPDHDKRVDHVPERRPSTGLAVPIEHRFGRNKSRERSYDHTVSVVDAIYASS